ncbi:hypothetical protein ABH930_004570 [Kitasatospora sp. GAS204A]|nr:hypothetical protein [Kitasatospora sp. GAS204B]
MGIPLPRTGIPLPRVPAMRWQVARAAAATAGFWGVAMVARLFIGGAVGRGDDGSGHGLMCSLNLAPRRALPDPSAYFAPRFGAFRWAGEACAGVGGDRPYPSSQHLLLVVAKQFTALLGRPGELDLRVLALLCCCAFAVLIGLLVCVLPFHVRMRVAVASMVALATMDSAIAPFFDSPSAQPAVIVGMLGLLCALLRLARREYATVGGLLTVSAVALWTLAATRQSPALLVGVVVVMLWRGVRLSHPRLVRQDHDEAGCDGRHAVSVLRGVASRVPALVLCAALAAAVVGFERQQSHADLGTSAYRQVFMEILPSAPSPPSALKSLGGDPSLAGYAGVPLAYVAGAPGYAALSHHVDLPRIAQYYALHPKQLVKLADRSLARLTQPDPDAVGNYPLGHGNPHEQEDRLPFVALALSLTTPVRWLVYAPLWLGSAFLGLRIMRSRRLDAGGRGLGAALFATAAAAVGHFCAVILTDGASGPFQETVPTVYCTLLLIPLLFATLGLVGDNVPPRPQDDDRGQGAGQAVRVEQRPVDTPRSRVGTRAGTPETAGGARVSPPS